MKISGDKLVINRLKGFDDKINQAASNAVNRAATLARNEGIDLILERVTLSKAYVSGRVNIASRSSPTTLRAVIQSTTRATILDRFDSTSVKGGVRVRVNRSGGYKTISGAFMVKNLKGSHSSGIALSNKAAARYYKEMSGKSSNPLINAKASKLANKAKANPGGIHVLHSRSINQLFESVREDIQPTINTFLQATFLRELHAKR